MIHIFKAHENMKSFLSKILYQQRWIEINNILDFPILSEYIGFLKMPVSERVVHRHLINPGKFSEIETMKTSD